MQEAALESHWFTHHYSVNPGSKITIKPTFTPGQSVFLVILKPFFQVFLHVYQLELLFFF